ncbi:MAG: prepilin peptidase [Aigarchaeota archaeon]|nr:prepilin peptidase [Aigarchaeota archaeon]MCS7127414.1 prepilin peptidase [Candidatus Calditenuaceae archaeon]MDW8042766.1 prepilin peptidase [Nitrososphaerota archaeon]
MSPLEALNAAVTTAMLAVASVMDLRRREVDDWVWLLLASLTLPSTAYLYVLRHDSDYPLMATASIAVSTVVALLFYRLGFYGGADAKAVIAIAIALPVSLDGNRFHPFVPITSLLNGLLISLSVPSALLAYNLLVRPLLKGERVFEGLEGVPAHLKLGALLLGTRVDWPKSFWAKVTVGSGKRLSFSPPLDDYFSDPSASSSERVWATPGIPLIVFIAVGHVVNLLYGDLLFPVVRTLPR